jgi:erythromycin esterase
VKPALTEDARNSLLGFDMQIARVAVANVEEYLRRVDSEQAEISRKILAPLADETSEREYSSQPEQVRMRTAESLKTLLARFGKRKSDYIARSSEQEWILTQHNLEIVRQAEELYSSHAPGVRDRYMADNVEWILDNEPPGTKIMLWAHNEHVWTAKTLRGDSMGNVLRQTYGSEMACP